MRLEQSHRASAFRAWPKSARTRARLSVIAAVGDRIDAYMRDGVTRDANATYVRVSAATRTRSRVARVR